MPGSIAVPYELADCAVGLHLVVGGRGTGLPHVVAAPNGEVACVVVDDDLIDPPTVSAVCVVCVHDEVDVGLKGVPILHDWFSFVFSVVEGSVREGRVSARLAIASSAVRIWTGTGRPRQVAFSTREIPSLDR